MIRADEEHFDFVLEGSVNGAGAALSWFERHQGAAADRLLALLDAAPLADDGAPFFLNGVAGLGSPFWRPDFESRFVGEGSELQQCRAVLESVAFLIKANLDEMDRHLDSAGAAHRERRARREPPAVPDARLPVGRAG